MNSSFRSTRFLIDKVDKKLGSVEKEIKFDKWMIFAAAMISVISGFLIWLCGNSTPVLSILFFVVALFGISVLYIMTRELIYDRKKQKSQKQLNNH